MDVSHLLAIVLIVVVGGTVAVTVLGWIVMGLAARFGWRSK
jgi:hypothetical protein